MIDEDTTKHILIFQEGKPNEVTPMADDEIERREKFYTKKLQDFYNCKVKVAMFPNTITICDVTPEEKKGFE